MYMFLTINSRNNNNNNNNNNCMNKLHIEIKLNQRISFSAIQILTK